MPTYQYACKDCDHQFEVVQSFSDSSLTDCPQCQGRLRKLFGAVGVIFKGSGFYRTDSRAEAEASGTSSSGTSGASAKSTDASGSSGKSDSGSSSSTGSADSGASGSGGSSGSSSTAKAAS